MRIDELRPVHVVEIPSDIEEGVLYISHEYKVAIHLCACGCIQKTVTPLGAERGWTIEEADGKVTLRPSIGNFMGENPYHAHYFITQNKIQWL
jgi:hypothetical protein